MLDCEQIMKCNIPKLDFEVTYYLFVGYLVFYECLLEYSQIGYVIKSIKQVSETTSHLTWMCIVQSFVESASPTTLFKNHL